MSPAARAARERMLDGLRRRNPAGAAIARRSTAVTIFKKVLPAAAILLLVALAVAPSLRGGPEADRIAYHIHNAGKADTASHMQGAQYHGVDQHGQPFTLTADAATDQGADDVALRQPEGDVTLNSGAWLMLKSKTGLFRQKSQQLGLTGDVTLYRNDGTTMTGTQASIDLKKGNASSNAPVRVQGPFGTLDAANGFALTDRGADIVFKGPAHLLLTQVGGASAAAPAAAAPAAGAQAQ